MKTPKKLLSALLALALSVYAMPTVWAEDITQQIQDIPENPYSDVLITDNEQTENEAETTPPQDGETITDSDSEDGGIMPFSLLPLETKYKNVTIDRSNGVPPALANEPRFSFFVREALSAALAEDGVISGSGAYNGTIMYSFDDDDYKPVGWNDIIDLRYGSGYVYFILGDDQLNIRNLQYNVYVTFNYNSEIIKKATVDLFNKNGESITKHSSYVSNYMTGLTDDYFYSSCTVSLDDLKGENYVGFLITLPANHGAANVEIYEGFIHSPNEIVPSKNITSQIISDGTPKAPYAMEKSYSNYKKDVTFVITSADGTKRCYPIEYSVYVNSARISMELSPQFQKQYATVSDYSGYNYQIYTSIADANNFNELNVKAAATYEEYNNGSYKDGDLSNIDYACFGYYDSKEDAIKAGETNIKNTLFSSNGARLDFSKFFDMTAVLTNGTEIKLKYISITVIDKNGIVYHAGEYLGIAQGINNYASGLSDDTYFNVNGAKKATGSGNNLSGYRINGSNDSYFKNGYQTMFILDGGNPVTASNIYPTFTSSNGARIYIGNDVAHETASTPLQTSGESPIPFVSGRAIQYSAASESGTHLKNYWVTFVTQQSGAKLFVNAVNNPDHYSKSGKPQREVFFNNRYGYYHDVFFANIGDAELNGINVSLSANAQGVKLDDYWTVIDGSVKKLAPFTKTNSPDNIAKVRLIPIDEEKFGIISGTLTISSANGGSVDIELTGVAGAPKIITDTLYDGVKYVPYSCIIMTNNMYGSSNMQFSIENGSLPNGMELRPNGELYGIPMETGEFTFTVKAEYNGGGQTYECTQTYTLIIKDNTDENVDATNSDAQGHPLIERVSKYITVYYNGESDGMPIVDRIVIDCDLFWSEGAFGELQDFYIDGIKLTAGSDYTAAEGSTKITVRAQTFGHIGVTGSDVPHTLAAEFRTSDNNELKRSAQNVYLDYINTGSGNGGQGSGNGGQGGNNNSQGGNSNNVSNSDNNSGSISAIMRIVDTNGDIVSGLSVELHSSPKYAKTDKNGAVKFDDVEFGRHTLYIKGAANNKKVSKTFSISSGQNIGMTGNVITASAGDTVYMTIEYDGSKIKILSVAEDVSSASGTYGDGNLLLMDISQNILSKRTLYVIILLEITIVFVLRRKIKL